MAWARVVLPTPRHVLDQQVPAGQQTGNRQADLPGFAENDAVDLVGDGIDLFSHEGRQLSGEIQINTD